MPEDSAPKIRTGGRPRSKSFLRISLENPYAQLGVSPTAPTDEITNRISTLLTEAKKRVRARASKSTDDPDEKEILRLQKIDEQIGDPKRRKAYDEKYPQNIMLTVQPIAAEQAWVRHRRAGLISEWLYDELGESSFLPTPRCLRLWTPSGLDQSTLDFLTRYVQAETTVHPSAAAPAAPLEEPESPNLSLKDLERFIKES